MTINLPANIETFSKQDLMVLTGQEQEQSGLGLPSLRVNYDDQDKDGNNVPRGHWVLATGGQVVYAPVAALRVMFSTYQYSHFDQDEQKMVSTSIHFQNWNQEVPDDAGGMKCGKLPKKTVESLSEAEKQVQSRIKVARVLFGLVSMEGVNHAGEKASITDVPAVFYAKGTNFMPMADYLKELHRKGVPMQTVQTQLDLKRLRNGAVTYWEVVPSTVKTDVDIAQEDFKLISQFAETAKAENEVVLRKWKKVQGGDKSETQDRRKLVEAIMRGNASQAPIDPDLNDAIPDNM